MSFLLLLLLRLRVLHYQCQIQGNSHLFQLVYYNLRDYFCSFMLQLHLFFGSPIKSLKVQYRQILHLKDQFQVGSNFILPLIPTCTLHSSLSNSHNILIDIVQSHCHSHHSPPSSDCSTLGRVPLLNILLCCNTLNHMKSILQNHCNIHLHSILHQWE